MQTDLNRQMSKRLIEHINEEFLKLYKKPETGCGINELLDIKYPIEWENEMGKFKVESENKVLFQPKMSIEFINIDIKVTPCSENNL